MNGLIKRSGISKKNIANRAGVSLPTLNRLIKNEGTIENYNKVLNTLDGELSFNVGNIKLIRKSAGLSQDQLANKAGITQASLSSIEAGNNGRVSNIFRIAKALNHHARPIPKQDNIKQKLQQIIKHTKNNGLLKITSIPSIQAKEWIIKHHYSKTWNKSFGTLNYGIFKDEKLMGVAVYGWMMNPSSHKKICNTGKDSIIELNRLHLSDDLVKNAESTFLATTFKLIKANHPKVKFINTFADGRLGCGTIYKATNFKYYGHHESMFFEDITTGDVYHQSRLQNTIKGISFLEVNRKMLDEKLKAFKVNTYRYIYSLHNDYSQILLKEQPYLSHDKDFKYIVGHTYPIGILCRLKLMYASINDHEYVAKVDVLLRVHQPSNIETEMARQEINKSLKFLLKPRLATFN